MNTKSFKSNNFGGWSLYLVFILAIIILWWTMGGDNQPTSMTKSEFVLMLQAEQITSVKVSQNAEVPTGNVTAILTDKSQKTMYVSDVNSLPLFLFHDCGLWHPTQRCSHPLTHRLTRNPSPLQISDVLMSKYFI